MQDALGFGVGNRHRLLVGAEEAGDLRRVLDQVIDFVGQVHLHQHVAGEELALGVDLAAAAHLGDLFLRHQDLFEMIGEAALLGLLADRIRDLVLEVRIGVDDVPALGLAGVACRSRLSCRCAVSLNPVLVSSSSVRRCRARSVTAMRITWSATRKKTDAIATMTKTMAVVIAVSLREGQVTLLVSSRTSCRNLNGEVAINDSFQLSFPTRPTGII